jgi:hypothetical protein
MDEELPDAYAASANLSAFINVLSSNIVSYTIDIVKVLNKLLLFLFSLKDV